MKPETGLFEVLAPARWRMAAVFNSPHSGQVMPEGFLRQSRLSPFELRQSEDVLVDELFSGCLDAGAPMLRALASRAWTDLNREPFELDPRMFYEDLPGHMNPNSPRVTAGFGTVPRYVGDGLEIYRGRIALSDALSRIETFYKPYHQTLSGLLDECHRAVGFVFLVDCHSMPSVAASGNRRQPDIVLGDRFGNSCAGELADWVENFFRREGLSVARNKPYAGGYITETYAAPQHGRHALQIEVNRGLYLDERKITPLPGVAPLRQILDRFSAQLEDFISAQFLAKPLIKAAE